MGTADDEKRRKRIEAFCRQNFPETDLKKLMQAAIGETHTGDPITPAETNEIMQRVAQEELISRKNIIEELIIKLLDAPKKKFRSLATKLLRMYVPSLQQEEDAEAIPPILFKALTTARDKTSVAAIHELLKVYPADAVREAIAKRLEM